MIAGTTVPRVAWRADLDAPIRDSQLRAMPKNRYTLALACAATLTLMAPRDVTAQDTTSRAPTLATPRTLRFTTDEGTWLSLDVSPDGRTLVFDLLGDLYTLPIGGGSATRITSGPSWDSHPRFAPDGKSIVFVSDRTGAENVWLADLDGRNARQLTRGDRAWYVAPAW